MGTENNGNLNKIKERVQKLLNQAADREGTAEGEIFYQKAFDLMAAYGFEERDLDNPDAEDEVIRREFAFSGSYSEMQAHLLVGLTNALHCVAFYNGVYGSTRVLSATVFGVKRHVDRIEMLFSLLNPQMRRARETSAVTRRCLPWWHADHICRAFHPRFTPGCAARRAMLRTIVTVTPSR